MEYVLNRNIGKTRYKAQCFYQYLKLRINQLLLLEPLVATSISGLRRTQMYILNLHGRIFLSESRSETKTFPVLAVFKSTEI